ncbi:NAD(P)H-binding protein [Nonomuraea maheshkhaliensis]|uniref:NAD(P)H-binding protein n=1 Tax=Nonomuraea maheshkhaliensis TaxID=419590 RepID=A0ABN2ERX0_9ACTN
MIVVTAPTGQIGRLTLGRLLAAGASVRVIVRDPARLPAATRERVEVVEGTHGDPEVVNAAFAGADSLFWLVPADPRSPSVDEAFVGFSRPASRAVKDQGVRRVVNVSALGRGTPVADRAGFVTASLAVDDLLASTGAAFRALAMPSFMENLLRQTELIRTEGRFTMPVSGSVKAPTCAVADIAAVAAGLLLDDTWTGVGEVPVLGPEDLSSEEMARIMSEVLRRPIRFQRVSPADIKNRMMEFGMSEPMAQAYMDMCVAKDAGLDHGVTRTPESSTPTGFRQWCETVLKPAVLG